MKNLFIVLMIVITGTSCQNYTDLLATDQSGNLSNSQVSENSLTSQGLRDQAPFPIGASLHQNRIKGSVDYRTLVASEFNSLTPETAMKMQNIHPLESSFFWDDSDTLVAFAEENNMRVHGHTLVWHRLIPDWVTNFQGDSAAWESLFENHIKTIVSRYKGKIISWDVVNEAMEDNGQLRNSIWLQKLGAGYIARAFQYAHEADPNALLFYNDYGYEWSVTKRNAIIAMVNNLVNDGIPIHGIGMQTHINYTLSDAAVGTAITRLAETGLKVHISELDIALNPGNDPNLTPDSALFQQQADKYRFIANSYRQIPTNQQFGITVWGVSDLHSWIRTTYNRPDWPLLFDDEYVRKPAYYGFLTGLTE